MIKVTVRYYSYVIRMNSPYFNCFEQFHGCCLLIYVRLFFFSICLNEFDFLFRFFLSSADRVQSLLNERMNDIKIYDNILVALTTWRNE